MTQSEVILLIKAHCLTEKGHVNVNMSRRDWWERRDLVKLKDAVMTLTEFADDCTIIERTNIVLSGTTIRPLCAHCNLKNTTWRNKTMSFGEYCSPKCASAATVDKRKKTSIEKYGADNFAKTAKFLEKSKATFIEKYGVDNPAKSAVIQLKIQKKFEEYAGGHPQRDPTVRQKAQKTALTKYGCHHTQRHVDPDKLALLDDYNWLAEYLKTNTVQQLADYVGMSRSNTSVRLNALNLYSEVSSGFQAEVVSFLKTLLAESDITINTRRLIHPMEIDIYIPTKNIAIECNGTYWHSELNGRGKEYHLNKSKLLADKGIHLIHVWEHEWNTRQLLVQSRLRTKLGHSKTIYARKCTIAEVSKQDKDSFLSLNHIQGTCISSVQLGLFYDGVLTSLMTFGKSRYDKNIEWELLRYCTLQNITVVGGASKLLKKFVQLYSPKTMVSYSAKEWNSGNLYNKLGFTLISSSPPAYYYTNDYVNFSNRVSFQKHKLRDILTKFDPDKTEWENMKDNGYDRIWDCGTDKWLIRF